MARFVLHRALRAMLIVGFIVISTFLILRLSSGDPALIRSPVFARPDIIAQYRKDFGTDRSLAVQLASFLANAAHGDLGQSFRYQQPVTDLIRAALPNTLMVAALALGLSLALAVALGSLAALGPQSPWSWISSGLAAVGQSAPVFWTGLLMVSWFAIHLRWLPAGGFDGPSSLVLPSVAVGLSILPTQLRVLRTSMEAVLGNEFIRTARAFGLPEWRVVLVYALRSACLPLVTVIGVDAGYLLGGVIVAEVVFNFPGIGQLALVALNARDYPLVQGITVVTSAVFVLVNLAIDVLYVKIDPRIRLAGSSR